MKRLESSDHEHAAYQIYGTGGNTLFALDPGLEAGNVSKGGYLTGYTGRALSTLKPGHTVCVPEREIELIRGDLDYLRSVGFTVPRPSDLMPIEMQNGNLVANMLRVARGQTFEITAKTFVPFVHSAESAEFAHEKSLATEEDLETSEIWNSKAAGLEILVDYDLPVTPGISAYDEESVLKASEEMLSRFRRIVIKAARGASGMDMWKEIYNMEDARRAVATEDFREHLSATHPHNNQPTGFRVEGWMGTAIKDTDKKYKGEIAGCPACLMFLKDSFQDSLFLGSSDQILSNDMHQGNRHPLLAHYAHLKDEISELAINAARILHSRGVRGPVGIDMIVLSRSNVDHSYFISEINQRWTGQMHALMKAHAVFGTESPEDFSWIGCNIPVKPGTTRDEYLEWLGERVYKPGKDRPMCLVMNTAPMADPEGNRFHGFITARTVSEARSLYEDICRHAHEDTQ